MPPPATSSATWRRVYYFVAVSADPWYALHDSPNQKRKLRRRRTKASERWTSLIPSPSFFIFLTCKEGARNHDQPRERRPRRKRTSTCMHVPALRLTVLSARANRMEESPGRELRQTVFGTVVSAESGGFLYAMQTGTIEGGVAPGHYRSSRRSAAGSRFRCTAGQLVDPSMGTPTIRGNHPYGDGNCLPEELSLELEPMDPNRRQVRFKLLPYGVASRSPPFRRANICSL